MANSCRETLCKLVRALLTSVLAVAALASAALAQGPESRFANVNGTRLHYLAFGKGEPIILLHGYAQTSHMWFRNDPPNAAWKKLSASTNSFASMPSGMLVAS